jgi:hypothetical protein
MILKATQAIGLATPPLRRFAIAPATSPPGAATTALSLGDQLHYDRLALWGVGIVLFAEIFFQKIALPLGENGFSVSFIFGFVGFGLLIVSGRVVIDAGRFILYSMMIAAIVASQLLGDSSFSTSSLLLLIVTYAIYVFRVRGDAGNFTATLRLYQAMTFVVAGAAVFQYGGQYFLPHNVVFPLEFLLGPFLIKNFNHVIPITYGSSIFKSNGMFLAEPSLLSQAMALSFIIERLFFRRVRFQLAYLAGLTVSYSGTGLLLLAVAGPFLLYRTGALRFALILLPVGALLLALGSFLQLDIIAGRAGEFGSENSSGFARFVSIFYVLNQFVFIDPYHFFFGMGAGSLLAIGGKTTYLVHDPTWGKLLFEYGFLGAVGFFPFILYSLLVRSASQFLAACLAFAYFFLGGYLLGPFYNFIIVGLVAWHRPKETSARPESPPRLSLYPVPAPQGLLRQPAPGIRLRPVARS